MMNGDIRKPNQIQSPNDERSSLYLDIAIPV